MAARICGTCIYFYPGESECRRLPPTVVRGPTTQHTPNGVITVYKGTWPVVDPQNQFPCGEYK